jgi:hypothetical protein
VPKSFLFCCWSLGYHKLWKCQSTLIKSKIKHLFKVTITMHVGNCFILNFDFAFFHLYHLLIFICCLRTLDVLHIEVLEPTKPFIN